VDRADGAIVRTSTPFERLHRDYFFRSRQHEGDLDFKDGTPDDEAIKRSAPSSRRSRPSTRLLTAGTAPRRQPFRAAQSSGPTKTPQFAESPSAAGG
jgi:hypothetical protein